MSAQQHASRPEGSRTSPTGSRVLLDHVPSEPELAPRPTIVHDVRRVLECVLAERRLGFQHLVRRYLSQILHGCKSTYCTTPTCLSSTRRRPLRPRRAPTVLTARALAHFLASQDDPTQALCQHELKVSPETFQIEDAAKTDLISRSYARQVHRKHGYYASDEQSLDLLDAIAKRRQQKKDTHSLGQNLYDSTTMILSFSKSVQEPAQVFKNLVASDFYSSDHRGSQQGISNHLSQTTALASRTQRLPEAVNGNTNTLPDSDFVHLSSRLNEQNKTQASLKDDGKSHAATTEVNARLLSCAGLDGAPESLKASPQNSAKKEFEAHNHYASMNRQGRLLSDEVLSKENDSQPIHFTTPSFLPHLTFYSRLALMEEAWDRKEDGNQTSFDYLVDLPSVIDSANPSITSEILNRSLFYSLSDPETLLKSFHQPNKAFQASPLPHLDSESLKAFFTDWKRRNCSLVFDSLWYAAKSLNRRPPELQHHTTHRWSNLRKNDESSNGTKYLSLNLSSSDRYLSTKEAAHIIVICIHALTAYTRIGGPQQWNDIRRARSRGIVNPPKSRMKHRREMFDQDILIVDDLEYEPALRLVECLLSGIGARTCFEHILTALHRSDDRHPTSDSRVIEGVVDVVIRHLQIVEQATLEEGDTQSEDDSLEDPGCTTTATFLEYLKTIILKKWDGKAEINKWTPVGTALMILARFGNRCKSLNLRTRMFEMHFFIDHLDPVNTPLNFLHWTEQPNTLHLLEYSCFFPLKYWVGFFRTINFASMMTQYDETMRMQQMERWLDTFLRKPYYWMIRHHLRIPFSDYLVLDVSRDNLLEDTLDQLWGQEKRMLLKPLKVKMGQGEGEVGLDHGGVTYEFFRVVLEEAFDPNKGMFTIDEKTRMIWFQPGSLEASWKFELLGLLMGLALYNGITLPVTFPLIFYELLLSPSSSLEERVKLASNDLDNIRHGWPDLAKGFDQLLSWTDGDVADVFMRDYAFSYTLFGQSMEHNMDTPYPQPQSSSATSPATHSDDLLNYTTPVLHPVSNANRHTFVRDFTYHLLYLSIAPNLTAFHRGFNTPLHPRSLTLLSPNMLRNLVEGSQEISVDHLRSITTYEGGYGDMYPTIQVFWAIIASYTQAQRRRLLEFVTASERVPVTGYGALVFVVVRNGGDTEALPTSSTCFGKLYLPEYAGEMHGMEKMRPKLNAAIENCRGFGIV